MRFIHTVISAEGFHDSQANGARMELLSELVRLCAEQDAKMLVIPAGFLTASSEPDMATWVERVSELANRTGVVIVGGVDIASPTSKRSPGGDELVSTRQLPYFGFTVGPILLEQNSGHPWRQTSTTRNNAHLVEAANIPGNNREVTIDGRQVGVLICGELFSRQTRNTMARLSLQLIVDIGHSGMGQGLIPAMNTLVGDAHCPVAHSQHIADWPGRSIHYVNAGGEQESQTTDANPLRWSNDLWAAWALRTI